MIGFRKGGDAVFDTWTTKEEGAPPETLLGEWVLPCSHAGSWVLASPLIFWELDNQAVMRVHLYTPKAEVLRRCKAAVSSCSWRVDDEEALGAWLDEGRPGTLALHCGLLVDVYQCTDVGHPPPDHVIEASMHELDLIQRIEADEEVPVVDLAAARVANALVQKYYDAGRALGQQFTVFSVLAGLFHAFRDAAGRKVGQYMGREQAEEGGRTITCLFVVRNDEAWCM